MRGVWSILDKAGTCVGSHMPVIVPACVALGIAFPGVFGAYKPIVPVLFAVVTFQGSLNTSLRQVVDTFKHPHELFVIMLSSIVIMPLFARLLAGVVFSDPEVITGVVVEYSIPVAVVSFMWVDMFRGNASLGLAAIFITTLIAPVTLPITLKVLMGASVAIDPTTMMGDLAFMVAIPAAAGVAFNELSGGFAHEKVSPRLGSITKILTLAVITSNATGLAPYARALSPMILEVALFIFAVASCGFLLGFVQARLMHAPVQDTITMVFCVGMRNISSGAVIASQFFPGSAIVPVMMGTLFQQVLAAAFGSAVQRLTTDERERQRTRVHAARERLRKQGE